MLLVFAMNSSANLSLVADFAELLQALQLGELLHQLLHAVLLKLYCNLRVVPIAFATKHRSFSILRVPDPRPLPQSGLSGRLRNLELGPRRPLRRHLLPPRRKAIRNFVQRSRPPRSPTPSPPSSRY